jgi:hypothetical protein
VSVSVVETAGEAKDSQPIRAARGTRKPRTGQGDAAEGQRFFLAKAGVNNSVPDLGREFGTEPEAIVESLKTGLSYFTVSEWRGVADFSGRKPQLRKEAVSRAPKTG